MESDNNKKVEGFFIDYSIHVETALSNYFQRLNQFFLDYQENLECQLLSYQQKLEGLHKHWLSEKTKYIEDYKRNAYDYNVFNIIGRSKHKPKGYYELEVITHSPFLADLLDSNSAHGQQELFYKKFINSIKILNEDKKKYFLDVGSNDYYVVRENNNIDILIRSYKKGNEFVVVIENKVKADDEDKQLQRYYDDVNDNGRFKLRDEHILLVYLTKDGYKPTPRSMDLNTQEKLRKANVLFEMSYKNDIKSWLMNCQKAIKNLSNINEVIKQYIKIIEDF